MVFILFYSIYLLHTAYIFFAFPIIFFIISLLIHFHTLYENKKELLQYIKVSLLESIIFLLCYPWIVSGMLRLGISSFSPYLVSTSILVFSIRAILSHSIAKQTAPSSLKNALISLSIDIGIIVISIVCYALFMLALLSIYGLPD